MEALWFCLVAFLLTGYVVLDGFDLGTGAIHLYAARTEAERRAVLASIGPVWDANEVWLLAAGGTLYFAFPTLYASSFMGFYLPLTIVLWLLMIRGIAIELRNHLDSPVWQPFWDAAFAGSSALLAIFFGAALGNVVRGVPLDGQQEFFLPLWTNWAPGPSPGILDWYTVLTGVSALAALTLHGSLWVVYRTNEAIRDRSATVASYLFLPTLALTILLSLVTFRVQPLIPASFENRPWGAIFPLIALAGLAGAWRFHKSGMELRAFLGSGVYLTGMLASVAFGLFPYVLPSCINPAAGLTVTNSAPAEYGLRIGLYWWIPGTLLALGYSTFLYRRFAGKV